MNELAHNILSFLAGLIIGSMTLLIIRDILEGKQKGRD